MSIKDDGSIELKCDITLKGEGVATDDGQINGRCCVIGNGDAPIVICAVGNLLAQTCMRLAEDDKNIEDVLNRTLATLTHYTLEYINAKREEE